MAITAKQLSLFSDADEAVEIDRPESLYGFSVRESVRAKRLSIKVYPRGRVEVVVPRRTRAAEVREFVEENRDWISTAREQFAAEHTPEPFALPDCVRLDGIERVFTVSYEPLHDARTVRYRTHNRQLLLSGRTFDEKLCVAALKRWLTSLARIEYASLLQSLSAMTGSVYKKMHVRGQRTCWGSHSSNGTISLNYCLMFLEPALLRYVMIHELCHARHMNHSRRFWALVGRFEPNYRSLDKALNDCWKQIPTWVGIY